MSQSVSPNKRKKAGEKRHSVLKSSLRSSRRDLEENMIGAGVNH